MDAQDKARLAREGVEAIEAAEPERLKQRLRGDVEDRAQELMLDGAQLLGRITGHRQERRTASAPGTGRAAEVQLARAFAAMDEENRASFDSRLHAAVQDGHKVRASVEDGLAELRKTFPDGSRQFAALVFACADLLEDLAEDACGVETADPDDLQRREQLIARVAQLLEPRAAASLAGFAAHVIALSSKARR